MESIRKSYETYCDSKPAGAANGLSQAMLRMQAVGIRIVWCTHDDIVAVAPDNQAQAVYDFMLAEMKKPPKWLLELPLNAEGFIDERYSK